MNENYKQGLMEGHNEDDCTYDTNNINYDDYDENIDWDEYE